MIASLLGYIKSTVTSTIDGCRNLYSNHGVCKDIRSKMQSHRDMLAETPEYVNVDPKERKKILSKIEGGISYQEYVFLQKGKEDRGKLMNIVFLMFGAPRFLPYALLFNPEMLPSPFLQTSSDTKLEKRVREQSTAVISCLLKLESQASEVPAMAKLNIFGGKKQTEKMNRLRSFNDQFADALADPNLKGSKGPQMVLEKLESELYRPINKETPNEGAFDRSEQRLCQVAPALVKGLSDALGSGGFLGSITPNFMNRGKIVGHAQKVENADYFLVNADIDLDTIPTDLLQEACADRMKGSHGCSLDEMRDFLREWLELTVRAPASRANDHFNGNLARTALMGYNSLQTTRDSRSSTSVLPRLLFSGNESTEETSKKQRKQAKREVVSIETNAEPANEAENEPKKKSWAKKLLRR